MIMSETLISDPRLDFIQDFTLKALRLKPDKWARMTISDEQRSYVTHFIERPQPQVKLLGQDSPTLKLYYLSL